MSYWAPMCLYGMRLLERNKKKQLDRMGHNELKSNGTYLKHVYFVMKPYNQSVTYLTCNNDENYKPSYQMEIRMGSLLWEVTKCYFMIYKGE